MAQKLNQKYFLKICHLYPDLMDTYGDTGNIITIQKRCDWREIKSSITKISVGDSIKEDFDFYFFGGGQDKTQIIVSRDLQKKKLGIKKDIEKGAVLLSICGGYQLLQKHFKTKEGEIIKGIGLFDAFTEGSNDRMIQNLLIEISPEIQKYIDSAYKPTTNYQLPTTKLVGFENHSGKTYLREKVRPLGKVIKGAGNNGEDETEGAIYKNAFGCYLHGSLLPKNPHFADFLISKALERRYGKIRLKPLEDTFEWQAHKQSIDRTRSQS